jgi:hypothetical protein
MSQAQIPKEAPAKYDGRKTASVTLHLENKLSGNTENAIPTKNTPPA